MYFALDQKKLLKAGKIESSSDSFLDSGVTKKWPSPLAELIRTSDFDFNCGW